MKFTPLPIHGAYLIEYEPYRDKRGAFMRHFSVSEFETHGLDPHVEDANISVNPIKGTLRGFHMQREPWGEAKTLSCWTGAIFDVIIDLRPDSPTYKQHTVADMTAHAIHVPAGCANAWLTMEPDTVIHYYVSKPYRPEAERGIRWDDPTFDIAWPHAPVMISDKDAGWPLWADVQ